MLMLEFTESGSISEGCVDPMSAPTSTRSMKNGREAMRSTKQTAQLAVVAFLHVLFEVLRAVILARSP